MAGSEKEARKHRLRSSWLCGRAARQRGEPRLAMRTGQRLSGMLLECDGDAASCRERHTAAAAAANSSDDSDDDLTATISVRHCSTCFLYINSLMPTTLGGRQQNSLLQMGTVRH